MKLGTAGALLPPVPNFSELIQNIDHFLCIISYYQAFSKFSFGTFLQLVSFCTQQIKANEISSKNHEKRRMQILKLPFSACTRLIFLLLSSYFLTSDSMIFLTLIFPSLEATIRTTLPTTLPILPFTTLLIQSRFSSSISPR